jgi:hypothetical protein
VGIMDGGCPARAAGSTRCEDGGGWRSRAARHGATLHCTGCWAGKCPPRRRQSDQTDWAARPSAIGRRRGARPHGAAGQADGAPGGSQ